MMFRRNPLDGLADTGLQVSTQAQHSNRIKKLPPLLVNQLAAGEVVTRPASVVKELIENALDAGARQIDVRITQGGMGIIEVADDGCGIHPEDMVMAVTRFATSKIADVAHLQGIATLGFRGEALAATAAVSRLSLTSCCDDSGIGRQLNVAGILEDTPQLVPVVHRRGTTVSVKDLYFNVPARRGNLKAISTEFMHIETVVKQLALVASDVSFSLWHNDKRRFNFAAIHAEPSSPLTVSSSNLASEALSTQVMQALLTRLKSVLPPSHEQASLLHDNNLQVLSLDLEALRVQYEGMRGINRSQEPLGIEGLIIPSTKALANHPYKLIYINGRLVKDKRIAQSLRESINGFDHIASLGYVLFFNLPKAWLNLNVHPSKLCIKIQNLANVMAHFEVGVREALQRWQKRQPIIQPIVQPPQYQINAQASVQAAQSHSHQISVSQGSKRIAPSNHIDYPHNSSATASETTVPQLKQPVQTNESIAYYQTQGHHGQYTQSHPHVVSDSRLSGFDTVTDLPPVSLTQKDGPVQCLYLLKDSLLKECLLSDSLLSDQQLALLQIQHTLYVFLETELIRWLQASFCTLLEDEWQRHYKDYQACVSQGQKLAWINTQLQNLAKAAQNQWKQPWCKQLADQALGELPLSQLIQLILKNDP
ncbi:DNA mismatch repair endonuclease MutL [Psychrobacter raelei]|uniref:DNA mismatch repair endonuclease MutL n=1 Tax=Psychrobacter raelei TaxID=2565531 RepID=UPI003F6127DE